MSGGFKNKVFQLLAPLLAKRISASIKNLPESRAEIEQAQRQVLESLSSTMSRCEFGQKLGIDKALNPEELQFFPITSYADYAPYIQAMASGKSNALWDSNVLFMAESSGSSAAKKYIPITKKMLQNQLNGRKKVVANAIRIYGAKRILKSPPLSFGDAPVFKQFGTIKSAAISAILASQMPFWSKWFTRPKMKTRKIPLFKDRIQELYRELKHSPPGYMVVMPVWLRDFFNALSPEQVRELLQNKPVLNLSGMSPKPYLSFFEEIMQGELDYLESYPSSEGFFGWQDRRDQSGIRLYVDDGIYYELLTDEGICKPMYDTKVGECGELIVTACNGFFRYAMGDLLRIVTEEPIRVEIIGRKTESLSVFGESVLSSQTDEVMRLAALHFKLTFSDYLIGTSPLEAGEKASYVWLIECESQELPHEMPAFLQEALGTLNGVYFNLCADGVIGLPTVIRIRPGHLITHYKKQGKVGLQHKIPRLIPSYQEFMEILKAVTD